MYGIERITGENLLLNYKIIKTKLEKALEYSDGERSAAQIILNSVSQPQIYQIWQIFNDGKGVALGSTRVVQYEGFTALHIITLAGETDGDLSEWSAIFEEEMKEQPIDMLELTGRRGFVKQLEKAGWTERYTTMRKLIKEKPNGQ
jgi:hypothetical protein|tara:strand:- start:254 stop:691 length:438 start_codon:yes stop_codon:yes gene_type:complete